MDMKLQRPPKSPSEGDFKPPDLPRTVGVGHPPYQEGKWKINFVS